jgi:steroid delta-isomerase-like uncharacterized protein
VSVERNRAVIRRFYDELWNQWNLDVADEIVAPHVRFRGSLGTTLVGVDAFKSYVEEVRAAFPDFQNQVDDLIAEDDKVVTRMTWSGTHRGKLFGIPATGRRLTYVGAGIFQLRDAEIQDAWIVGDTQELWRTLRAIPKSS